MKTQNYNPSPWEQTFAQIITDLKDTIQNQLSEAKIVDVHTELEVDNPSVRFNLEDSDGDPHEIVVRVIERID
ncbi:hypothetical protein [Tunicatimonas pelagia]|uniref:hypothetical protein n=1 Tax=Tunicatimonas pelagia TaxID=931531 RepID=UPI0026653427|nr:hypothetical protein [Tunicatimonas pelagia]WKN44371.1 hypothetical protein P0M28_05255 [Tunicatimonas pelagia]